MLFEHLDDSGVGIRTEASHEEPAVAGDASEKLVLEVAQVHQQKATLHPGADLDEVHFLGSFSTVLTPTLEGHS